MGTRITAYCPDCGQQDLRPADVLLLMSSRDANANHYRFTCPGCSEVVEKRADIHVVRVLRSTGEVRVEHFEPAWQLEVKPAACVHAYTEDELLTNIIALYAAPSALVESLTRRSSAWNAT